MKIKKIKLKQKDNSLSENIPFSINASNIDMEDGNNLEREMIELKEYIDNKIASSPFGYIYRFEYNYQNKSIIYDMVKTSNRIENYSRIPLLRNELANIDTLSSVSNLKIYGTENIQNMSFLFGNICNITSINELNTINATNLSFMFFNSHIETICNLNTKNTLDMHWMFTRCNNFIGPLPNFNTYKIKDFSLFCSGCENLTGNIPNFNTSNATNMYAMFADCQNLTGSIPNFNTSHVTGMANMFYNCRNLTGNIPDFNTSNVTDMTNMFAYCNNLTNISNIVNMCINSNITLVLRKNLSNTDIYSPLYGTKFNNSYFTDDEKARLTAAGWRY